MMCLGWYNRPQCAARPDVQVQAPLGGTQDSTYSPCPSSTWFWLGALAIIFTKLK